MSVTQKNQLGSLKRKARPTKIDNITFDPGSSTAGVNTTRNIEMTQLGQAIATFNSPFTYELSWEKILLDMPVVKYIAGIERALLSDANKAETNLFDWPDRMHKIEINLGDKYGFLEQYESVEEAGGKIGSRVDWNVNMRFALDEGNGYSPPIVPESTYGPVFRTLYIEGLPSPTRVAWSWGSQRKADLTLNGAIVMNSPFIDAGVLSFSWRGLVDTRHSERWFDEDRWIETWDYIFTQYTKYSQTVTIKGLNPATGERGVVASGAINSVSISPQAGQPPRVNADMAIALKSKFI